MFEGWLDWIEHVLNQDKAQEKQKEMMTEQEFFDGNYKLDAHDMNYVTEIRRKYTPDFDNSWLRDKKTDLTTNIATHNTVLVGLARPEFIKGAIGFKFMMDTLPKKTGNLDNSVSYIGKGRITSPDYGKSSSIYVDGKPQKAFYYPVRVVSSEDLGIFVSRTQQRGWTKTPIILEVFQVSIPSLMVLDRYHNNGSTLQRYEIDTELIDQSFTGNSNYPVWCYCAEEAFVNCVTNAGLKVQNQRFFGQPSQRFYDEALFWD